MTTKEIDGEPWNPEEYRLQVWEGDDITWNAHKINDRNQGAISSGDLVVLFFSKSRTKDYGIYGWGIITKFNSRTNKITFTPTFPSDYLKTSPVWDERIESVIDQIRVPTPHSGTMWAMTVEEFKVFRTAIRGHFGPAAL